MVGMQNGCICCTLQTDLVKQIVQLTQSKQKFNYILIEASGVSEPHEIAPLFDVHDHDDEDPEDLDHDHDDGPQLGEVARLDTCVTVIDSSEFYNNLGSMTTYDQCDVVGTIAELMMDQVEFANLGDGQVAGRYPDDGPLVLLSAPTPGATNDTADVLEP